MTGGPAGGGRKPGPVPGVADERRARRNTSRRPGGRAGPGADRAADGAALTAQTVLAGRYRLEELLSDQGGSMVWKATDQSLARSVTLCVLAAETAHADDAITAARAAARLSDPRLVQIFDADDRGDTRYIVTEWPSGERLDQIIAAGPLDSRRAAEIVVEVASAVAVGHAAGLAHLCLTPDLVWRNRWGEVKLSGLGTAAALAGAQADDPALADTRGLARLLYAALTGHWPGPEQTGLPAAELTGDRPGRPGQVRDGIPADIDALTWRALFGDDSNYGPPILNPAGLAVALRAIAHPSPDTQPLSALSGHTEPFAPVPPSTRPLPAIQSFPASLAPATIGSPGSAWPAQPPSSQPPSQPPPSQAPPSQPPPSQAPPSQPPPSQAPLAQAQSLAPSVPPDPAASGPAPAASASDPGQVAEPASQPSLPNPAQSGPARPPSDEAKLGDPQTAVDPEPGTEPAGDPRTTMDPQPVSGTEPARDPQTTMDPQPASSTEPARDPQTAMDPEPVSGTEPARNPQTAKDPQPVSGTEPARNPQTAKDPQPVSGTEPARDPQTAMDPEPVFSAEPARDPETAVDSTALDWPAAVDGPAAAGAGGPRGAEPGPTAVSRSLGQARAALGQGSARARVIAGQGSARARVIAGQGSARARAMAGQGSTRARAALSRLPQPPAAVAGRVRTGLVILVLVGCAVAGWVFGNGASQPGGSAAPAAGAPAQHAGRPAGTLRPASAASFDPYGDGQGSQLARLAIDSSPATAWHTAWYTTAEFGNLKPGTGLLIDMGRRASLTTVKITLGRAGADFQVRVGSAATLSRLRPVAHAADAGSQVRLRLASPARGRYVLIWFTKLPRDAAGTFEASIYNLRLQGFS